MGPTCTVLICTDSGFFVSDCRGSGLYNLCEDVWARFWLSRGIFGRVETWISPDPTWRITKVFLDASHIFHNENGQSTSAAWNFNSSFPFVTPRTRRRLAILQIKIQADFLPFFNWNMFFVPYPNWLDGFLNLENTMTLQQIPLRSTTHSRSSSLLSDQSQSLSQAQVRWTWGEFISPNVSGKMILFHEFGAWKYMKYQQIHPNTVSNTLIHN